MNGLQRHARRAGVVVAGARCLYSRHYCIVSKLLVMSVTGLVMLSAMWVLNIFGGIDEAFHFRTSWLHLPLSIFYS